MAFHPKGEMRPRRSVDEGPGLRRLHYAALTAEVGAELHVNSSWHAQVSPEDNVSRHVLRVQKFVSPCAGPWFFETSSGVFWNETEKISMDPAAGNPNLQDVPDVQHGSIGLPF